jgi:hypothetical protein
MRNFLTVLAVLLVLPSLGSAVDYYVDPDFPGSVQGTSSNPWTSLGSSQWNTINNALNSDHVTVYFSAREASSDTDEVSNNQIQVLRTSSSSNRVTLDGMSKYNTNDASPSWNDYSGSSRFRITPSGSGPLNPVTTGQAKRSYVTLRGFKLEARSNQNIFYYAGDHVVIEHIEATHLSGSGSGPGIYFHYASRTGLPSNDITVQYCTVHDTYGEGIYIGGSDNNGGGAHSDITIQYNTVYDPASRGGEPDCMETKDGSSNVVFRGNICYMTNPNSGRDGIGVESAALIEDNFIYNTGRNCITLSEFWDTGTGYRDGSIIRNNILVNCGGNPGYSWDYGILVNHESGGDDYTNVDIFNNDIISVKGTGISVQSGVTGVAVKNNIVYGATGTDIGASGDVSNNLVAQNPLFVNMNPPYVADNFKLQPGSPAIDSGTPVSLSSDFEDNPRPMDGDNDGSSEFDIGAYEYQSGSLPCSATSGTCHYVDNAANGNNDGTSWTNAWQGFSAIDWNQVDPGDIVYISGGPQGSSKTYYETLSIGKAGTNSNPIKITVSDDSNHNGQVIIDGQNTRQNGVLMQDWTTLDGVDSTYRIKVQNTVGPHVRKTGTGNPTGHTIRYVEITGRSSGSSEGCIHLAGSQSRNNLIENCYIHDVGQPDSVTGITITNNVGDDSQPYTNNEIRDCIIRGVSEDGIQVRSATYIHDNIVSMNTKGGAHHDGIVAQGNNVWIVNNDVSDFGQNVYINTFNGAEGKGIKVIGNVVYQTSNSMYYPDAGNGIVISPQSVSSCGTIDGLEVEYNTVANFGYYGVRISSGSNCEWKNSVVKNNLFINNGFNGKTIANNNPVTISNLVWDNNYYSGVQTFLWEGNSYSSVSDWSSGEGYDVNGKFVTSPNLEDPSGNNFRLTQASADLINAGEPFSLRTMDIDGTACPQGSDLDIGAYEYSGSPPQDTCQSLGHDCCIACQAGTAYPTYDSDCLGTEVCCGSCQGSPTYPGPGDLVEAEDGQLTPPMQSGSDPGASGGQYVYSGAVDQGQSSYTFQIDQPGSYRLEAMINSRGNGGWNSFFVGLDSENPANNNEYAWDTAEGPSWEWDVVSLRGPGGDHLTADYDPKVWQLDQGTHTFVFAGREANSWLDQLRLMSHCHLADIDCGQCIDTNEIVSFIGDWKQGLRGITMTDVMSGIGLYNTGQGCP